MAFEAGLQSGIEEAVKMEEQMMIAKQIEMVEEEEKTFEPKQPSKVEDETGLMALEASQAPDLTLDESKGESSYEATYFKFVDSLGEIMT